MLRAGRTRGHGTPFPYGRKDGFQHILPIIQNIPMVDKMDSCFHRNDPSIALRAGKLRIFKDANMQLIVNIRYYLDWRIMNPIMLNDFLHFC